MAHEQHEVHLDKVQPLESMSNFTVPNLQDVNSATISPCSNNLVDSNMLIGNICHEVHLPTNAPVHSVCSGGIESTDVQLHENISHEYENPCTFELKDSDLSMLKAFPPNVIHDCKVPMLDTLRNMEPLDLIPSSEQILGHNGNPSNYHPSEPQDISDLLKLNTDLCFNYDNLCRLCANKGLPLLPLYHGEGLTLNLLEKIHRCLPIKVSDGDDLPAQVCKDCSTKLQICDDLIRTSISANEKLHALKSMKVEYLKTPEKKAVLEHCSSKIPVEPKVEVLDNCFSDHLSSEIPVEAKVEILDNCSLEDKSIHGVDTAGSVINCDTIAAVNDSENELNRNKYNFRAKHKSSSVQKHQKHCASVQLSTRDRTAEKKSLNKIIKKSFVCEFCDKSFISMEKWKKHELSHTKRAKKKSTSLKACTICEEKYFSTKDLKEHYLTVHNQKGPCIYSCDQCDKSFSFATSLDIHKATHSNETPCLCDLCGKSFKHVSNLRSHKRIHSGDTLKRRHACDMCPKSFPSKFQLSEHRNIHLNITPYSCTECDKKFSRKILLRQHKSVHTSENSYACPQCGERFNRKGNMTQHLKKHSEEKTYICYVCKASFLSLREVVLHRRSHSTQDIMTHFKGRGLHPCEQCSKLFSTLYQLQSHSKTHLGMKFECSLCNKVLSNRRTLEYHTRSLHTGERPYKCEFCPDKFMNNEARIVHERLHTGEKPFPCSVCGMGFRCSSILAQHLKSHQDDRPFACDQCSKKFKRKGVLLVHKRTHTGEKPFCCDQCGRRFAQKNDMLKHQSIHTFREQPFSCSSCNCTFERKKDLHSHISTYHAFRETKFEGNITSSQPQTLVISDTMESFPVTIMEDRSNLIVQSMEDGTLAHIIEVDPNLQVVNVGDPLLHSVVTDPQSVFNSTGESQIIRFGEDAVILHSSDNNVTEDTVILQSADNNLRENAVILHSSDNNLTENAVILHSSDNNLPENAVILLASDNNLAENAVILHSSENNHAKDAVILHSSDNNLAEAENTVILPSSDNNLAEDAVILLASDNNFTEDAVIFLSSDNNFAENVVTLHSYDDNVSN